MPTTPEPFVTAAAVAEYLGCTPKTIYNRVHAGQLPSYSLGGHLRFRLSEIEAWAESQAVPARRVG